jgi:putative transposase
VAAFRVLIQRPIQPRAGEPASRVGVDVGVRVLATVAGQRGQVIERVPNPRPLEAALKELRHLSRERSRRTRGSRRCTQTQRKMIRQKGLPGARARRRGLSDSALGETRRQLACKTGWYGSRLVIADRWYPSSKTCHTCGHVQEIRWNEHWTCTGCGTSHQRDDNAAINLARYEPLTADDSALGPVRAAVKRGADRKTRPRRAGGDETRKGPSQQAEKQPRDGVPISDSR